MIATMISAGTPNSLSARASSAACAFQYATPPSIRAGDRNRGAYSYHFGGSSSGEHAHERRAVETLLRDQLGDERLHVSALGIARGLGPGGLGRFRFRFG